MRYLGVDYGKKKVGLAISEGELAQELKTVAVNGLNDALAKVTQVIRAEKVDQLVVGMPESGEARNITQAFIKSISPTVKTVVVDETLTSQRARSLILGLNVSQSKSKDDDKTAAALILQDYLDRKDV